MFYINKYELFENANAHVYIYIFILNIRTCVEYTYIYIYIYTYIYIYILTFTHAYNEVLPKQSLNMCSSLIYPCKKFLGNSCAGAGKD